MPLGKVRLRLERRNEGEVTLRRGGLGQPLSNLLRSGRQLNPPVLHFLADDTHALSLLSLRDADHDYGVERKPWRRDQTGQNPKLMAR